MRWFLFLSRKKVNPLLAYSHLHDCLCFAWWNLNHVQLDTICLQVAKECVDAGDILGPNLILHHLEQNFRCLMKIIRLQMLICGSPREDRSPLPQIPYLLQKFAEPLFGAFCETFFSLDSDGSPSRPAIILLTGGCICNSSSSGGHYCLFEGNMPEKWEKEAHYMSLWYAISLCGMPKDSSSNLNHELCEAVSVHSPL